MTLKLKIFKVVLKIDDKIYKNTSNFNNLIIK